MTKFIASLYRLLMHSQRYICLPMVVFATTAFGQSDVLETMARWRTGLAGKEVSANITIGQEEVEHSVFGERLSISGDSTNIIIRKYLGPIEKGKLIDIFGCVEGRDLAISYTDAERGLSTSTAVQTSEYGFVGQVRSCHLRHLLSYSLGVKGDSLGYLMRVNEWQTKDENSLRVYRGEVDGFKQEIAVEKTSPSWPKRITLNYSFESNGIGQSAKLEIAYFSSAGGGVEEQKFPTKISVDGMVSFETTKKRYAEVIEILSIENVSKDFDSFPEVLTEMQDGLEVRVAELPQIKFEWRNNDVVRSVDGKVL